jgi:hypothetical protein
MICLNRTETPSLGHSPSWPPFRPEKLQETSIPALDSILARVDGEAIDIWSRCREFRT